MQSSILQNPVTITIDSFRFTLLQCKWGLYSYNIYPHFHGEHYFELNYIISGSGTLVSDDDTYSMEPDAFFLHGPQVVHSQHPAEGESITDYCITLEVYPGSGKKASGKPELGNMFYNMKFYYGKDKNGQLLSILKLMHQEIEHPMVGHDIYLQGLFQQFIITMIRYYCKDSGKTKNIIHMDLNEYRHMIIDNTFINKYSTLTLEQLAASIRCSPRQVQRILQENYGKTFRQLKTYYIMAAAASYLTSTSKSMEEISLLCGYASVKQFQRSFKAYYQVTPKQYRSAHKK